MSTKMVKSKRNGKMFRVVEVAVGFTDRNMDMFRLYREDGSFTSVDRDTIRRHYVAA